MQIPLFLTTHSLETHRPWKVEQLGNGYFLSRWIEQQAYRTADGIIAVSEQMRTDVVEAYGVDPSKVTVIHNGIDPDCYQPTFDRELVRSYGIDPDVPFVLFVGRITRQKGISQLIAAARHFNKGAQVILYAGAPAAPRAWVAVVDRNSNRLAHGEADQIVQVGDGLPTLQEQVEGGVTAVIEATGSMEALASTIPLLGLGGTLLLLGYYQTLNLPYMPLFLKEARLLTAKEWAPGDLLHCRDLIADGTLDVAAMLTHCLPITEVATACDVALNDANCLKLVLDWQNVPSN